MYYTHQTPEEVKNVLQRYLADAKSELTAWEGCTIERTKDGREMAQIGRAIKGGKLSTAYPAHDATHPVLYVYWQNSNGYGNNYIHAYIYTDNLPDKGASRATVWDNGLIRPTSPKTAQELREAIAERIAQLKERIESYTKQVELCETAYKEYRAAVCAADAKLKEICAAAKYPDEIGETSLYYEITRTR